jgi:pre-mRNA-processing factor SLU7
MRENPYPNKDPKDLLYAGDNWVRHSGDAKVIMEAQRFVWDANDKGTDEINILSNPSQAEAMFHQFQDKKQKLKDKRKQQVLSKYGGEQHLEQVPTPPPIPSAAAQFQCWLTSSQAHSLTRLRSIG